MTETTLVPAERATESQHWYDKDGKPAYEVTGKNGKIRNATLRDARVLGLVPSVTMIANEASKPALIAWKERQVLMAALTLPRIEGEDEETWISRIMADSKEQARKAAERGTEIHKWIQQGYEGVQLSSEASTYFTAVADSMTTARLDGPWLAEQSFAHPLGYGGKVDLNGNGRVLDIKTKESPDKFGLYDEHAIQLAAYREGLGMPTASCGIVFVTTQAPIVAMVVQIEENALQRGWRMFRALLDFWYARTGLARE